jgi:uracil-DNA glycosylase family protein
MPVKPLGFHPDQHPQQLIDCRRCPLWEGATQPVPGSGPRRARLMVVGEQPGDQEDLQGKAFVGPAGALLDNALIEARIDRKQVYITNAVKHFKWEPRGKRRMHKTPAQREVDACHYWIERELAMHEPEIVIALGATALKSILQDSTAKLQASMDQVIEHDGRRIIATFHPSYALRAPDAGTRQRAYQAIVDAFRRAQRLIHDKQGPATHGQTTVKG